MILKRLINIWKLSAYEPGQPADEYKTPGTQISMLVKKPVEFIKYNPKSPVEEFISEQKPQ